MTSFDYKEGTGKKAILASENKCKCGHILMDHKFMVKDSDIVYAGCKECNCKLFEKENE